MKASLNTYMDKVK